MAGSGCGGWQLLRGAPRGAGCTQGLGAGGRRDLGRSHRADGSLRSGGGELGTSPRTSGSLSRVTLVAGAKLLSCLWTLPNRDGGSASPAPPPHPCPPLTRAHPWALPGAAVVDRAWQSLRAPQGSAGCFPLLPGEGFGPAGVVTSPVCWGSPGSRDPSSPPLR